MYRTQGNIKPTWPIWSLDLICIQMQWEQSYHGPTTHLHCPLGSYKDWTPSAVIWSCGYCTTAVLVTHRFGFWLCDYGMIIVQQSCHGPTTHLHCPLNAYKASEKSLQLYGQWVIAREPFKWSTGSIFGYGARWGVVEQILCDACRLFLSWTNHSFVLPSESIYSSSNNSAAV